MASKDLASAAGRSRRAGDIDQGGVLQEEAGHALPITRSPSPDGRSARVFATELRPPQAMVRETCGLLVFDSLLVDRTGLERRNWLRQLQEHTRLQSPPAATA